MNNLNNTTNISEEYKPFYFFTYDPTNSILGKKSDKSSYTVFYCKCYEKCEAFNKGCCFLKNGLFNGKCPYGKIARITGPTKRAKSYYSFLSDAEEKYKDLYTRKNKIYLQPIKSMCKVGENYIYISLPHLNNYVNSIDSNYNMVDKHLLPLDKFTPGTIRDFFEFKPQALFGGVITSYQKDLTIFAAELYRYDKNMYNAVKEIFPKIENYFVKMDYKGKKAYLKTLLPGKVGINATTTMEWDGKVLTGQASSILFSGMSNEVLTITPKDDTIVEIIDDNTVDEDKIKLKF